MTETQSHDGWPPPYRLPDAAPYWKGLDEGRLTFQRCTECGEAVWPAHSFCPHCDGPTPDWQVSGGRGALYSFSTVMRGPTLVFTALAPYTVGFVEMDEGYFLFAEIQGAQDAMRIGCRVEVRMIRRGEQPLPVFVLA